MPLNDFDAWMMQTFATEVPESTVAKNEDYFLNEFAEWCNELSYEEICNYVEEYVKSLKEKN